VPAPAAPVSIPVPVPVFAVIDLETTLDMRSEMIDPSAWLSDHSASGARANLGEWMKVFGTTLGIKSSQIRALTRLYHRRLQPEFAVTLRFARELAQLSVELHRRVGVLVDRRGRVERVMVGDARRVELPDLGSDRSHGTRLRGLRLVSTRLGSHDDGIPRSDLSHLIRHRLDLLAQLDLRGDELEHVRLAHLLPPNPQNRVLEILPPVRPDQLEGDFLQLLRALEEEFDRSAPRASEVKGRERAILVTSGLDLDDAVSELRELAGTSGALLVDVVTQRRDRPDPRTVLGRGKLEHLGILILRRARTW